MITKPLEEASKEALPMLRTAMIMRGNTMEAGRTMTKDRTGRTMTRGRTECQMTGMPTKGRTECQTQGLK